MSVSGAYLEAIADGVAISGVWKWEADDSGSDVLDATTGGSEGATDTDVGCADLKVTLHLLRKAGTGFGVDLRRGSELTNVNLYLNADDPEPAYELPLAVVINKPQTVEVRGRMEATCVIKNKGPYTENL